MEYKSLFENLEYLAYNLEILPSLIKNDQSNKVYAKFYKSIPYTFSQVFLSYDVNERELSFETVNVNNFDNLLTQEYNEKLKNDQQIDQSKYIVDITDPVLGIKRTNPAYAHLLIENSGDSNNYTYIDDEDDLQYYSSTDTLVLDIFADVKLNDEDAKSLEAILYNIDPEIKIINGATYSNDIIYSEAWLLSTDKSSRNGILYKKESSSDGGYYGNVFNGKLEKFDKAFANKDYNEQYELINILNYENLINYPFDKRPVKAVASFLDDKVKGVNNDHEVEAYIYINGKSVSLKDFIEMYGNYLRNLGSTILSSMKAVPYDKDKVEFYDNIEGDIKRVMPAEEFFKVAKVINKGFSIANHNEEMYR